MPPPSLRIDAARARISLDPRDRAFVQDPYPAYAAIRAACPIFFWEQYGHWACAAHADVAALFKDRRFGRQVLHVASRAELGWPEPPAHLAPWRAVERHSLLELEPPDHTRLRALVNRAFVSRQVERLRPRLTALAHELIDGFGADGEAELLARFATPIPVIMIADLLGVPPAHAPELLEWSHAMVAMYQFGRTRETEDRAVAATLAFAAFLRGHLDAKRRRPSDDLMSQLIAAEAAGDRLSGDELISTCILLLNAGHEATVHAIGNGVKALLEAGPAAIGALHDPARAGSVVEEVLRHDAPLHMFTRHALETVEIGPAALRTGDLIGLLIGAANRDPARFPEPDRFDPNRFDAARAPGAHMSFGAGIHFCVGAALARLELEVALPILFARLPRLALAAPPRFRDSYHFHGLEHLDVRF